MHSELAIKPVSSSDKEFLWTFPNNFLIFFHFRFEKLKNCSKFWAKNFSELWLRQNEPESRICAGSVLLSEAFDTLHFATLSQGTDLPLHMQIFPLSDWYGKKVLMFLGVPIWAGCSLKHTLWSSFFINIRRRRAGIVSKHITGPYLIVK